MYKYQDGTSCKIILTVSLILRRRGNNPVSETMKQNSLERNYSSASSFGNVVSNLITKVIGAFKKSQLVLAESKGNVDQALS